MREANKAIKRERHPMPTIEDLINELNGSTVFSRIDLHQAFHQLELYIKSCSTITEPLRKLTRNSQKWQWGKDQNKAFNKLKDKLTQVGVMAYFDPKKETEILVDASPCGLGAILTQQGKIVCYASRALTDVETRYSQTEREMLVVVYGVERFHMYLNGSPDFTVTTDHKPLLGIIRSMKPCSARIARWRLRLMPYQFKLIYRPGKDEANPADYLSRHPPAKPIRDNEGERYIRYIANTSVPNALSLDEVRKATSLDEQLKNVMSAIMTGRWNDKSVSAFKSVKEELSVFDGIILRQNRVVIPTSLQMQVIRLAHASHQGIVKTKQLIREKVWFPGIDQQVESHLRGCIPCL
ncbi:transposon Ty3-G Gag-Pol polyprotein [Elysia marginata]|uniref:Transposon Ty3-G Gag-Pol polyprotein n=1 Tax=Elysia marginata TaxID=1093978 RepID=A0AAV4GDB3_9GAST|nr:transposon Ty3-G Gag-Pol polyprotein [Elysia marginata]